MIGQSIAHYQITAKLGQGGMGEVYRATDSKLKREIALKILPENFAQDPRRMARFQREAEVLASLNHPNIGAIFGIEDAGSRKALALELIEGEELSLLIARGPVPLEETLGIALQIIAALEAAHQKGIVHRDLKPANIKTTLSGTVKVLDFGLAKATDSALESDSGSLSDSPTLSIASTQLGVILGTAAYMAPEQARGQIVDKRADIWALGAVMFEMLSGSRAFQGEDVTEVLASVVKVDVDWHRLPNEIPPRVKKWLQRCLQADPQKRLHDVADLRIDIEEYLAHPDTLDETLLSSAAPPRRKAVRVAGLILFSLLAFLLGWILRPTPREARAVTRWSLVLPEGDSLSYAGRQQLALSADGRQLIYTANSQLYSRKLDQLQLSPIPGTAEDGGRSPALSPDGQSLVFWASELRRVAVGGGTSVFLCESLNPTGLSWAEGDRIFFGQGTDGIFEIPAGGGEKKRIVEVDGGSGEMAHGPQLLPDGDHLLFTLARGGRWDEADIVVQSLKTGQRKVLVQGGADARYIAPGYLLYAWRGTIRAVAFDPVRVEVRGQAVTVLEDVRRSLGGFTGTAHFSVSDSGNLAYVPGADVQQGNTLMWIDRKGQQEVIDTRWVHAGARISPQGDRVAVAIATGSDSTNAIWILNVNGSARTRLTFGGDDRGAIWTPDGSAVVFTSNREGAYSLFRKAADGSGPAELLITQRDPTGVPRPYFFTPDGRSLLYSDFSRSPGSFYLLTPGSGDGPPVRLNLPPNAKEPSLSHNGRWMAYSTFGASQPGIYVVPFPDVGGGSRWQVTNQNAQRPVWGPDGSELFYVEDGKMMRVAVSTEDSFSMATPEVLFDGMGELKSDNVFEGESYDITPDGKRFIRISDASFSENRVEIVIVENWLEELRLLLPLE